MEATEIPPGNPASKVTVHELATKMKKKIMKRSSQSKRKEPGTGCSPSTSKCAKKSKHECWCWISIFYKCTNGKLKNTYPL